MDAVAPDFELRGLLQAGDLRAAGAWLVQHHARDVIALCRSMLRERALAEDLTQDVFASAFEKLKGFRLEASARTWLLAIARNRCIDHLRRAGREPVEITEGGDEPELAPDQSPLPQELLSRRVDVEAALGELDENERALVVLRFRHGLEYAELASVFGLKEGTVRMRLSRALSRMRGELERREGPELGESVSRERAQPPPPPRYLPAPGAPPRTGAPARPPAAAPMPAAMAAPVGRDEGSAIPEQPGFFQRLLRWIAGEPVSSLRALPDPAFARALEPAEPELTLSFRERLGALVSRLPER